MAKTRAIPPGVNVFFLECAKLPAKLLGFVPRTSAGGEGVCQKRFFCECAKIPTIVFEFVYYSIAKGGGVTGTEMVTTL